MEIPTTETEAPAPAPARGKIKLVTSAAATMNLSEIRKSVNELVALHERKKLAAEAYKDSIEAIATKGGGQQESAQRLCRRAREGRAAESARGGQPARAAV